MSKRTIVQSSRHELRATERREPILISAPDAAQMLSISKRMLWTHTQSGAIPSRRIGRSVRYVREELLAWVAAGCPTNPNAGDRLRITHR